MSDGSEPQSGDSQENPFTAPPTTAATQGSKSNVALIVGVVIAMGFMMLVCGGILLALLLPAVQAAREAARRASRANNMKVIGMAMHNYHAAYNQLPFTVVNDASGRSMLGWRLAVAPFVEGQPQWEMLDQSQPWDSPANRSLVTQPPAAFQSMEGQPGDTHIFAVVAPDSVFPDTPDKKVKFDDATDGLSSTLMLIELPNRSVAWTSTENVTPDEAFHAIQSMQGMQTAHLLIADGAVHAVGSDLDRDTFDAIITKSGGETVMGFGF